MTNILWCLEVDNNCKTCKHEVLCKALSKGKQNSTEDTDKYLSTINTNRRVK